MDDYDGDDKASIAMDAYRDFYAELLHIMNGSDADATTTISLQTASFSDFIKKLPFCSEENLEHFSKNPWLIPSLLFSPFFAANVVESFPLFKTDDWHTGTDVPNAIRESFAQVLEQLCHPGTLLDFDVNEPTISLCTRVLTRFEHFCKELSIENSSYASFFTSIIMKTAEIAKEVVGMCADQLRLPEDEVQQLDDWILSNVGLAITGRWFPADTDNRIPEDDLEVVDDDLVGLSDDLKKIKEQLLSSTEQLDIIPITGMGGIGKTTLATRVYEDPEIKRHFHVRAWTTVSQNYQKREVLRRLLQSIAPLSDEEISKQSCEQLGELLWRRLKGRSFLIVVDDIWATDDWEDIRQWFPDDENCSRIVVTSRLTDVGNYVNPVNPPHSMKSLSVEDSWSLLCKKLSPKQTCPPELVSFGLQIADKCQGLPLAIVVLGGHLSKIITTPDCWENVANSVSSLIEQSQEKVYDILSLSYDNLPQSLKACFLYMGTFPKNSEIPIRKLIRLWTSAGFLQAEQSSSLEEMVEKRLDDLISRNLVEVKRRTLDGEVKTCGIHDLLWDLILIKARQEGEQIFGSPPFKHTNNEGMKYLMGLTRSSFYYDPSLKSKCPLSFVSLKYLKVLDVLLRPFIYFPDEITELVNLRYLALSTYGRIPGSVCKLRHLETFINIHRWACPVLPEEIWLLPRLRHLHVGICANLPDPSSLTVEECCVSALLDLRTLSSISFTSCTKDVFLKFPNVKELEIQEIRKEILGDELLFDCLSSLAHLQDLQKLKLRCSSVKLEKPRFIPPWYDFVPNIKQLTLVESHLEWKEMNDLAMLPNLEVLKVKKVPLKEKNGNNSRNFLN